MDILMIGEAAKTAPCEPLRYITFRENVSLKNVTHDSWEWLSGEEVKARDYELEVDGKEFVYTMKDCYSEKIDWKNALNRRWNKDSLPRPRVTISKSFDTDEFLSHKPVLFSIAPENDWTITKLKVFVGGSLISDCNFSLKEEEMK